MRVNEPFVKTFLRRVQQRLPSPPSINFVIDTPTPSPYSLIPPRAVIYDIGSKEARGRYFGGPPQDAKVICVDIAPGPGVDIVADAQAMPEIPSESADCVFLVSVLQHLPAPQDAINEAFRVLRPGGIIYINVPFIFVYHRDPDDYYRFSVRGVEYLCSKFERISSGPGRGPASTFGELLIRFIAMLLCFNSDILYATFVYCGKWGLF
jgi:SAM-dependent methyltransferase